MVTDGLLKFERARYGHAVGRHLPLNVLGARERFMMAIRLSTLRAHAANLRAAGDIGSYHCASLGGGTHGRLG